MALDAILAPDGAPLAPSEVGVVPDPRPVLAVLVCHDGAPWLPRTLEALEAQRRRPDLVVAVDAGSEDGTPELLAQGCAAGVLDLVVTAPRTNGFGASVGLAIRAAADLPTAPASVAWLWTLHDDCVPAPEALEVLLTTGGADPAVAVIGPKLVGGPDGRRLLEVGTSVNAVGRRETGLEPGEVDQGQRDEVRDVLAVGTAGMLVRFDRFTQLGGLDPLFPLFRDDLDLGWRARLAGHRVLCEPRAVVEHVEAARRGLRPVQAGRPRIPFPRLGTAQSDRSAAALVLLLNCPLLLLPVVLLRLAGAALLRAVGLFAASDVRAAGAELLAVARVLLRPDRVLVGRWRRRHHRVVRQRDLRPYFVRRPRHVRALVGSLLGAPDDDRESGAAGEAVALGLLAVVLGTVGAWPLRSLIGASATGGGAAAPAPGSLRDLGASLLGSWLPVGMGASGRAPGAAGLLPLGLASLVTGGSPALAETVLLLVAVPAAGVATALALRPLVGSRAVRCWAGAAYALLPPVVAAAWAGRPLAALAALALPILGRLAFAAIGPVRPLRWAATAGTALMLALVTAAAPVAGLAVVPVLVGVAGGGLAGRSKTDAGRALRALLSLAGAAVVLAPFLAQAWHTAYAVLAGAEDVPLVRPSVRDLLLLDPGGLTAGSAGSHASGLLPLLMAVPVLAAGLAGLLVGGSQAGRIRWAWLAALAGLATALAATGLPDLLPGTSGDPVRAPWSGPALAVGGLGVVTAAALGAEAGRARLRRYLPGWRHVAAVGLAVLAGAAPLAAGVGLVAPVPLLAAGPPSVHASADLMPAFVAADLASPSRPRALVLVDDGRGPVRWDVVRRVAPHLGAARGSAAPAELDGLVATLVSGTGSGISEGDDTGSGVAARLAAADVRYVVVPAPVQPRLRQAIDAVPGLTTLGTGGGVWEVSADPGSPPVARLRAVDADGRTVTTLAAGDVGARVQVPPGAAGRLLILAEEASSAWRVTLDGAPLQSAAPPQLASWQQAWRLPQSGGELRLRRAAPTDRSGLLVPLCAGGTLLLTAGAAVLRDQRRRRLAEGHA